MKKTILTLAFASVIAVASAQDNPTISSKQGVPVLPEAGEWAIGFDATPFLNLLNASGSEDGVSAAFTSGNPGTLYGKYMRDAQTAYRLRLRIGFTSSNQDFETVDINNEFNQQGNPFAPTVFVNDERKSTAMDITLGAGIEKRRGKGRLQGLYGAEAILGFGSRSTEYNYGNQLNENNVNTAGDITGLVSPGLVEQDDNVLVSDPSFGPFARTTEIKGPSTFRFGVRPFVGVEFFYGAKMSIGAEFGWGIIFETTGEVERTSEAWSVNSTGDPAIVSTVNQTSGKRSSFGVDNDNLGGAINLFFYF